MYAINLEYVGLYGLQKHGVIVGFIRLQSYEGLLITFTNINHEKMANT